MMMLALSLGLSGCVSAGSGPSQTNEPTGNSFVWNNPDAYGGVLEEETGLRDPFILKDGEWWYLVGTSANYEDTEMKKIVYPNVSRPGVSLYRSQDLRNWSFVDLILPRPEESQGKWYQERFWAPELFQSNGKYYLAVNCSNGELTMHATCLAVADQIQGPYTVMTQDEPLFYGNDTHFFKDDDGRVYLYASGIVGAEIDLTTGRLMKPAVPIISPIPGSDAWNGQRERVGFEGPYVMKRNGLYYLFYSTWSRGYEVGVAVSRDPLSGWEMEAQPLYGSMDRGWCDNYGGIYEEGYYIAQEQYSQVGHNSIFLGPDGTDWITAHCYTYDNPATQYVMDRVGFDRENRLIVLDPTAGVSIHGPTFGQQRITWENAAAPQPVKALDVWGLCGKNTEYLLPDKVDILFENGWREAYPVTWEGSIDTSAVGEQQAVGTVVYQGQTFSCAASVKVVSR